MATRIIGLHHVTATVDDAQEDVSFYTGVLGLRLVKRTVNFDNTGVYHLYYGNRQGSPGTIMTTFPYGGKGVRVGLKGAGQITVTSFSVPAGSLGFWKERLDRYRVSFRSEGQRFGDEVVSLEDPSGLILELVETEDSRPFIWTTDEIAEGEAIRGIHSVTLAIHDPGPTLELFQDLLGFDVVAEEGIRTRIGVNGFEAGKVIDILEVRADPAGINGLGTVHHVALAVPTDEAQLEFQETLRSAGFNVTDVRDRNYFRSIYFREKGGILIELATEGPGFLIDEDDSALGEKLMLPPWEERRRAEIEGTLPEIKVLSY